MIYFSSRLVMAAAVGRPLMTGNTNAARCGGRSGQDDIRGNLRTSFTIIASEVSNLLTNKVEIASSPSAPRNNTNKVSLAPCPAAHRGGVPAADVEFFLQALERYLPIAGGAFLDAFNVVGGDQRIAVNT